MTREDAENILGLLNNTTVIGHDGVNRFNRACNILIGYINQANAADKQQAVMQQLAEKAEQSNG